LDSQGRPVPRAGPRRRAAARRSGQPARFRPAGAALRRGRLGGRPGPVARTERAARGRVPRRPGARRPGQIVRAGLAHAAVGARSDGLFQGVGGNKGAVRHRPAALPRVRFAAPGRASSGRARRAVHPDSARRRRGWRLGRARRPEGESRDAVAPGRPADRRPARGPEPARVARRNAGRFRHRVRTHPRLPGIRRPRPPHLRLQRLDGRRRDQGRSSTEPPTKSASTPSKTATTSPTSTPPSCTNSASTRANWKSPAANGSRSTTAGRSRRSSRECGGRRAGLQGTGDKGQDRSRERTGLQETGAAAMHGPTKWLSDYGGGSRANGPPPSQPGAQRSGAPGNGPHKVAVRLWRWIEGQRPATIPAWGTAKRRPRKRAPQSGCPVMAVDRGPTARHHPSLGHSEAAPQETCPIESSEG
jgi:hypothetical protein